MMRWIILGSLIGGYAVMYFIPWPMALWMKIVIPLVSTVIAVPLSWMITGAIFSILE